MCCFVPVFEIKNALLLTLVLLLFVKTKAATIVLFPNDNTLLELHIQMNEVKPVLDWLKQ